MTLLERMLDGGVKDGPSSFWSVFASAVDPSAVREMSSGRMANIMLGLQALKRIVYQTECSNDFFKTRDGILPVAFI